MRGRRATRKAMLSRAFCGSVGVYAVLIAAVDARGVRLWGSHDLPTRRTMAS